MSLDPHWFSTIFGLLFIVGQGLTALAFVIAVLALLATTEPMRVVPDVRATSTTSASCCSRS